MPWLIEPSGAVRDGICAHCANVMVDYRPGHHQLIRGLQRAEHSTILPGSTAIAIVTCVRPGDASLLLPLTCCLTRACAGIMCGKDSSTVHTSRMWRALYPWCQMRACASARDGNRRPRMCESSGVVTV